MLAMLQCSCSGRAIRDGGWTRQLPGGCMHYRMTVKQGQDKRVQSVNMSRLHKGKANRQTYTTGWMARSKPFLQRRVIFTPVPLSLCYDKLIYHFHISLGWR